MSPRRGSGRSDSDYPWRWRPPQGGYASTGRFLSAPRAPASGARGNSCARPRLSAQPRSEAVAAASAVQFRRAVPSIGVPNPTRATAVSTPNGQLRHDCESHAEAEHALRTPSCHAVGTAVHRHQAQTPDKSPALPGQRANGRHRKGADDGAVGGSVARCAEIECQTNGLPIKARSGAMAARISW
jgi:hypothetical protein